MSVLVKGMVKPKSCIRTVDGDEMCPFVNTDGDCVLQLGRHCYDTWEAQYADCLLVELPKGEWLRMSDLSEKDDNRYKCSRCGNVIHHKSRMDLYTFNSWCGRCGSDNSKHTTTIEADNWKENASIMAEQEGEKRNVSDEIEHPKRWIHIFHYNFGYTKCPYCGDETGWYDPISDRFQSDLENNQREYCPKCGKRVYAREGWLMNQPPIKESEG